MHRPLTATNGSNSEAAPRLGLDDCRFWGDAFGVSSAEVQVVDVEIEPARRTPEGRFVKGFSGHPSGKRQVLLDIEQMLDENFRRPDVIRGVLEKCKEYGFSHLTGVDEEGREYMLRGPDAGFAKIFLERVLGPVKDRDVVPEDLLADAPDEVLVWIRRKRGG